MPENSAQDDQDSRRARIQEKLAIMAEQRLDELNKVGRHLQPAELRAMIELVKCNRPDVKDNTEQPSTATGRLTRKLPYSAVDRQQPQLTI